MGQVRFKFVESKRKYRLPSISFSVSEIAKFIAKSRFADKLYPWKDHHQFLLNNGVFFWYILCNNKIRFESQKARETYGKTDR